MKEKLSSDMAKAKSLLTPTLAKKNIVVASLNPKPPIEIGNKEIAPIKGRNIKK
jgi:hypothetical protein